MDSDLLVHYSREWIVRDKTFEEVITHLTRWITRCMTEWFAPDWAVPFQQTAFDEFVAFQGPGDHLEERESGERYFLGKPDCQVLVTRGTEYWTGHDWTGQESREERAYLFRIIERTLQGNPFPVQGDRMPLFRLDAMRLPYLPPEELRVYLDVSWYLPPSPHETALKVLGEEFSEASA